MTLASRRAFWFGPADARAFGVLHRPAVPAGRGVVICNALGFEAQTAHRAFRHLADRLAGRGYTVLRFEYPGTGDSAGSSVDPDWPKTWIGAVDAAVGLLRVGEGIGEVSLVGLRAGATFAALYGADHPGIDRMVLWNPCVHGRAYARELVALARLSAAARPAQHVAADWFPADSLEVAGFEFTRAAQDALGQIDLVSHLTRPPARSVLVVDRTDAPPAGDLVEALADVGTAVEQVSLPGYADFMVSDESKSVLPVAILDHIAAWLTPGGATAATTTTQTVDDRSEELACDSVATEHILAPGTPGRPYRERPVLVEGGLFAVLTEPEAGAPRSGTAVLMANTGAVNRTGPGRMYVTLARYWASRGHVVVRVDLGGTGDTPLPSGSDENAVYARARTDELFAATRWLRSQTGAARVVVFGVCSGAFHAFHAATEGVDAEAVVLVNPAIFYLGADDTVTTSAGKAIMSAQNITHAMLRPGNLRRMLHTRRSWPESTRRALKGFKYLALDRSRALLGRVGVSLGEKEALARDLRRIADRRIDMLMVFSAEESGLRYARIFAADTLAALERDGRLRIVEVDGGDHIFSPIGSRQRLAEIVTTYLDASSPAPVPAPTQAAVR